MNPYGIIYWKVFIIIAVYCNPGLKSDDCKASKGVNSKLNVTGQSPINIDLKKVIGKLAPKLIFSSEYSRPHPYTLINNNHTIQLNGVPENILALTSGPINGCYRFKHLNFHIPSEHTVDNHFYPMELHVVHERTTNTSEDKYVIIAYGFEIVLRDNVAMARIVDALSKLTPKTKSIVIKNFVLTNLIGCAPSAYFTYDGSLIAPPYTEPVKWIISTHLIKISSKQIQYFHKAAKKDPTLINHNRLIQELNGRQVYLLISLNDVLVAIKVPHDHSEDHY